MADQRDTFLDAVEQEQVGQREGRTERQHEDRDTESRTENWVPPSILPNPTPEDGYVYRWIRTSLIGKPDNKNVSVRYREGWEPVLAENHPELMIKSDEGSRFEGNIEVGGLLLCRTAEENVRGRNDYYQQKAQQQMESVEQNFMRENDPRMPLLAPERASSTTFGTGLAPKAK